MKIVRGYINEKFTEDSDPVVDMGIGLRYVYDNLKDGDVLMFKKDLTVEGSFNGQTDNKEIAYKPYDNIVDYYNDARSLKLVGFHSWTFNFKFFKEYFTVINPK